MTTYHDTGTDLIAKLDDRNHPLSGTEREAIYDEIVRRVREAEDYLDLGHEVPPYGDVEWVYHNDATGKNYVCSDLTDMLDLYDLIHDEDEQISVSAYSHWCAGTNHPEQDDE
jgi:hypothetical protein